MSFSELNLHPKITDALSTKGYTQPTEIQNKAIPEILKGSDIRASAQTGTGKTAAFLLPSLNRLLTLSAAKKERGPRVLILAPTRELALQIATQTQKYSKNMRNTKTVCVVGGMPYPLQMRQLSRPYDILIATPGRLLDYIKRKKITLSHLEILVLDEADRMLDMGFVKAIEEIVAATPSTRQTLMFSATLKGSVLKLSEALLEKPVDITVHTEHTKQENITQKLLYADDLGHKNRLLDHILGDETINSAIIFTSTKRHAAKLVEELKEKGHRAAALHGDMNQNQRSRTINKFDKGHLKLLVATDVAARGIDIRSITHVINFDLPRDVEDYVHRIGRTGRAGATGTALSFAAINEKALVSKIETFTGQNIDVSEIQGLEPRKVAVPKRRRTPSNKWRGKPTATNRFSSAKKPFKPGPKRPSSFKRHKPRPKQKA